MHEYWDVVVGSYDDDAPSTLPSQLQMLRVLDDLRQPDLALIYRLQTVRPDDLQDPAVVFDLRCVGRNPSSISPAEAESLRDMITVGLLPGYNLYSDPPRSRYSWHYRVVVAPYSGAAIWPIKDDWSSLIDLMRRRDGGVAVELAVTSAKTSEERSRVALDNAAIYLSSPTLGTDRGAQFFRESLITCESVEHRRNGLALSMIVHAELELDRVFLNAIGRMIFGVDVIATQVQRAPVLPMAKGHSLLGCPEQVIRVWHAPYGEVQGRGLNSSRDTQLSLRTKPPVVEDGVSVGFARWKGAKVDSQIKVEMEHVDRTKHVYVVGKTGSGKTNLLKHMVAQDIASKHGVAVIDPHGDLVEFALASCVEQNREVVYLDFSDADHLPKINPLTLDIESDQDYRLAVEELIDIIARRSYSEFAGPVFDDTCRLMLESVRYDDVRGDLEPSIPLAVELLRNKQGREWTRKALEESNRELSERWAMLDMMLASSISEQVRWATSKFADFMDGNALQLLTAARDPSPLSIKQVYNKRQVLLVKLPETGMGTSAAQFLGSLLFSRLYNAARGSSFTDPKPFFIYVDEFQRFVTHEVEELVAEARKFNVSLTFAHQNLRQLEAFSRYEGTSNARLAEAIFSNVGTMIVMKSSGRDVPAFATELQVTEHDVRNIAQYQGLARAVIGGREQPAFTLIIPQAKLKAPTETVAADDGLGVNSTPCEDMVTAGFWGSRTKLLEVRQDLDDFRSKIRVRPGSQVPPTSSSALRPKSNVEELETVARTDVLGTVMHDGDKESFLKGWNTRTTMRDDADTEVPRDTQSVKLSKRKKKHRQKGQRT